MNNKYFRYVLGIVLLAMALAGLFAAKSLLFIISIFFIVITTLEYRKMFKQKEICIHRFIPELVGIVCAYQISFSANLGEHIFVTPVLVLGTIFSFAWTIIRNKKPYIATSLATISAFLFILCGLYITKMTYFYESTSAWLMIVTYFGAILLGDLFACIVGKKIQGKALSREISPNKTLAGSIAHFVVVVLCSLALIKVLGFNVWQALGFGVVTSIFAQIGDLTFSAIKRDLGLTHSGSLFCDFGGLLDRMDSFIISAPVVYYYLSAITVF